MASCTEHRPRKCKENCDLNSDFKEKFQMQLKGFYSSQSGTVKKPWTRKRILEVIMLIKNGKMAMDSGIRRNPTQYYWCKKYELKNVAGEDYLILKKNNPEGNTIRIVPMEQYFDYLYEIHKESGHGGRDKMLHAIRNRYYIQKKAIEIFVSLCPTCESKRNLREIPKKLTDKVSCRDSGTQYNPDNIPSQTSQVGGVNAQSQKEVQDSTLQNSESHIDQTRVSPNPFIPIPIKVEMDKEPVREEFVNIEVEPLQSTEISVDPLHCSSTLDQEDTNIRGVTARRKLGDKMAARPAKQQKVNNVENTALPSQSLVVMPSTSPPETTAGVEPITLVWSSKLQALGPIERLHAEKAINDVLFDFLLKKLGNGERSSGQ